MHIWSKLIETRPTSLKYIEMGTIDNTDLTHIYTLINMFGLPKDFIFLLIINTIDTTIEHDKEVQKHKLIQEAEHIDNIQIRFISSEIVLTVENHKFDIVYINISSVHQLLKDSILSYPKIDSNGLLILDFGLNSDLKQKISDKLKVYMELLNLVLISDSPTHFIYKKI